MGNEWSEAGEGNGAVGTSAAARPFVVSPTPDAGWRVVEDGFNLAREHEVESVFAVSNGYVGTRASLEEGSALTAPATFLAGIFDRGPSLETRAVLVAAPSWMGLRATVAGHRLDLESGTNLLHRRILDMRQGLLWREWRHQDGQGRITRMRTLRLVSRADAHALFQLVELTPENYSGQTLIEHWVASPATPATPGAAGLVPVPVESEMAGPEAAGAMVLALRTRQTERVVAFCAASMLTGAVEAPRTTLVQAKLVGGWLVERRELEVAIGQPYQLARFVTVYTSRDAEEPADAAVAHLDRLTGAGAERLLAEHVAAWQERWRTADVEIEGDEAAQRALRFAEYHLIAVDPQDEHVSIGARALTGASYQGHVFWDTEIYMLPFYLYTHPSSARALLMYRYHTLAGARANARRLGWRGALYAWESADTGEEMTPPSVIAPDGTVWAVLNGTQENHISADVAYAVWQYWTATQDERFLRDAGAEILLETARFWASRGAIEEDGRYHIRHVIGPDEYHENVDDSAYTNVLAQWNLERAAEVARLYRRGWPERWRELAERIELEPDEPERWSDIARRMYTGFDPETGLFEQFQGFYDLEAIDLAAWEPRTAPMDVLLGRERTQRTRVVKQADVVMLMYLLWDRFPAAVREANFRYYEPLTGHGSSLSPAIHALVAARLGDMELATRYFLQAAEIDLADNMGNASGGVHAAALGGLWQAVVFGFGGLRFGADGADGADAANGADDTDGADWTGRGDRPDRAKWRSGGNLSDGPDGANGLIGPALDPRLPPGWRGLRFPIHWRGTLLHVSASAEGGKVQS